MNEASKVDRAIANRMMGDKKMLVDNYASMQKWMTWMHNASNYETGGALKIGTQGLREMPGLGDWCTPRGNFWDSSNSPEAAHFNNCVYKIGIVRPIYRITSHISKKPTGIGIE